MKSLCYRVLAYVAMHTCSVASPITRPRAANEQLQIDVGYAIYEGYPDGYGANAWNGIRYAAPPTGNGRWRGPQAPAISRDAVLLANSTPNRCPQSLSSPEPSAESYDYEGSEDCLFLDVSAPEGASNFPVLVYIHGGGYGAGSAQENFTQLMQVNDFAFLTVAIQYRLEAFGFLSSESVRNDGVLNAGLLDQHFALEWIQNHIAKFGGDPRRVTIMGQSAGAGSVEMQAIAYGGSEGTQFFEQGIASSPYTPALYSYSDSVPTSGFLQLAQQVGCFSSNGSDVGSFGADPDILACLRSVDSSVLQLANYEVGASKTYGDWTFVPVVDGTFIQQLPSQQLTDHQVNGARILTSNNADDGASFVDPTIVTEEDFQNWLRSEYPLLTTEDMSQISDVYYPLRNESATPFSTCGDCGGPTAVNVGAFATGNQQRAIDFYSEATFDCPSLWLAAAYQGSGRGGYKYQFSIPSAYHGLDLTAEALSPFPNYLTPNIGVDFFLALTTSWGNFVKNGDPSISNLLANGNSTGNTTPSPVNSWPPLTDEGGDAWQMMNWNQTGGVPYMFATVSQLPPATQYGQPGLMNAITLVDAYDWEGGRGDRCAFLRSIGSRIPL